MRAWVILALVMWAILLAYTGVVVAEHGPNLLPIFFGDIARMAWPGQFNLDFMLMLVVSASWTAWRNRLRPSGLLLGVVAFFLGASFLLPYLSYLIFKHRGDAAKVLLGDDYRGVTQ